MRLQAKIAIAAVAAVVATVGPAAAQGVGKYLAPRDQVIAIRAGKLFDAKSGALTGNQGIVIRGDRIADVGANVDIPAGAAVIDLSNATVLPGMIDAHVHVNTGGDNMARRTLRALANAQIDLAAGFTTVLDMDSRGSFYTVDLRDAIAAGNVQGPRMQVVGQSLNQRATNYYPDPRSSARYAARQVRHEEAASWCATTSRPCRAHSSDRLSNASAPRSTNEARFDRQARTTCAA